MRETRIGHLTATRHQINYDAAMTRVQTQVGDEGRNDVEVRNPTGGVLWGNYVHIVLRWMRLRINIEWYIWVHSVVNANWKTEEVCWSATAGKCGSQVYNEGRKKYVDVGSICGGSE